MKRRLAIIMAALLIAAMAGCQQSGTSSTADSSTTQSSVTESAESEISEAESSVVSEVTSAESSDEKSDTSVAESSDKSSKTESSQPKTEESSKKETSKAESSKAETSKTESSKPESSKAEEPKVTGINLDMSSLSLTAGNSHELNAYILWSNGTSSYQGITWSSSNTSVATVSSSGYVTAKSAGTATITASYGSFSKSCTVTVKATSQPSSQPSGGGNGGSSDGKSNSSGVTIKFTDNTTVEVGKESSLAIAVYENGSRYNSSNYNISYKSSNTSVATVGSDGFVKGISQGTCTITATYGSSTATCTVTVKVASGSGSGGGSSSTKDEYYYDEFGNKYSTTWVESEHEAFKTQTRKGYTIWECPEMVPIINEYRAKEGKSPLYWYSSDKAKAATLKDINRNLDEFKIACPEWFNSDGSFNFNEYCKTVGQGCRDNCEYHMDGNPDPHGSNYSSNVAECVHMSTGKYGVRRAVEGWMNSPAHRAYIMKLEGSVYICHDGYNFYLS